MTLGDASIRTSRLTSHNDFILNVPVANQTGSIADIAEKALAGERLSLDDGRRLYEHPDLLELGALADIVRRRKHPEPVVTFNIGRNINYTNVCWVRCKFCAAYNIIQRWNELPAEVEPPLLPVLH